MSALYQHVSVHNTRPTKEENNAVLVERIEYVDLEETQHILMPGIHVYVDPVEGLLLHLGNYVSIRPCQYTVFC